MFRKMINRVLDARLYHIEEKLANKIKQDIKRDIKEDVRSVCIESIAQMFSNEKDSGYACHSKFKTIGGHFKERAIAAIEDDAVNKCETAAKTVVLSDGFIDSIVERINNKQLK